jgi:hypothetical protein
VKGPTEHPTVPAMASIDEAQYRALVEGGMTWHQSEARRADTQRRIRAVKAMAEGES